MDISYFREFVMLAQTQNYWAAAERLFIGQSSLSKHIMTLEKQLGAPLFTRTSRRVALTEFGRLMLPYAQSIARLQYEYESAAFSYLHDEGRLLRISTIPALTAYNIADILVRFQLDFPRIKIQTDEADTLVVREQLFEGRCDLAIYRDSAAYLEHDPVREQRIVRIPYVTDRLVAVLPKNHPLEGEDRLELARLRDERFTLIKRDTLPYSLCLRACREAGFTPKVLFTSHSLDAVLDMVNKRSCVALLFEQHAMFPTDSVFAAAPPFTVVPIIPEIQTTVCLAYLKDTPLSTEIRHFIDYCMMYKNGRLIPKRQESTAE